MNLWLRNFILLALMVAASGLAFALRPTHKIADQGPKIDLEAMIPRSFGEWHEEKQASAQIVDPQQKELLDKIYSQLLTRTYVNPMATMSCFQSPMAATKAIPCRCTSRRCVTRRKASHCRRKEASALATAHGTIPATCILTNLGPRVEPVTVLDHGRRPRGDRRH